MLGPWKRTTAIEDWDLLDPVRKAEHKLSMSNEYVAYLEAATSIAWSYHEGKEYYDAMGHDSIQSARDFIEEYLKMPIQDRDNDCNTRKLHWNRYREEKDKLSILAKEPWRHDDY